MLLSIPGFSQITNTIEYVSVNNQTNASNCGTIDFGTTSNNNLVFYFNLEKPQSQAMGDGYLKVMLKNSPSSNGVEKASAYITSNLWGPTEYSSTIPANISANEVQVNGSSIYLEYYQSNSPTTKYKSCEYAIIKTPVPTFTLSPATVTVPCNSTSPVTFTVTNVNNSPGTLEHIWTIGSGWKLTDGTNAPSTMPTPSNTLTLVPNANPPGNVSVVPRLNNVNYPSRTSMVSLSPFNPAYPITGSASLCTTAIYSVNNLPAGITVTGWSTSNSSVATATTLNATQGEVTAIGNGIVTVRATIQNSCGQTKVLLLPGVIVGKPTIVNHTINGGFANMSVHDTSILSVNPVVGATEYYWTITPSTTCSAGSGPRFSATNTTTFTTTSTSALIKWNDCIGDYAVVCYAKNSCGQSYIATKWVNVFDSNTNPCRGTAGKLKVVPNPIKVGTVTLYKEAPIDPCNPTAPRMTKFDKSGNDVKIYDLYGKLVYSRFFNSDVMSISDLKLNSGNYIVNVISTSGDTVRQMIIVE